MKKRVFMQMIVWFCLFALLIHGHQGVDLTQPYPFVAESKAKEEDVLADEQDGSGDESWIIRWKNDPPESFFRDSVVISMDKETGITLARPGKHVNSAEWAERWNQSAEIDYIEYNAQVSLSTQYQESAKSKQYFLNQIGMYEAWESIEIEEELLIAVVDTGIDYGHPDLKGLIVEGTNLIQKGQLPHDDNGHGTNVTGVLAATLYDEEATKDVGKIKFMPIKSIPQNGSGKVFELGEGIRYAIDHGAKVIVLALGFYNYSPYLHDIVQEAEKAGVLLVAASGNEGKEVKYPAAYPTVLGIGGVRTDDKHESSSNYGPEIDLVAPWNVYTTARGGGYQYSEGTSMAAPQVAAVGALLLNKYPNATPLEIRNILKGTTKVLSADGWNVFTGFGVLRADKALSDGVKVELFPGNNAASSAKPLSISTIVTSSMKSGNDEDWFYLDAPYDGTLVLGLQSTLGSAVKLDVSHYSSDIKLIKNYQTSNSQKLYLPVKKGRFYVQIKSSDRLRTSEFSYQVFTDFHIYRDAFEDNDRMYRAFSLAPKSHSLKGTFHKTDDNDWYSMEFDQPGTLRLSVMPDTMRMNVAMRIVFPGDEKDVIINDLGDGESEYSRLIHVKPGKYYFLIHNDADAEVANPVVGEYTFNIDYKPQIEDPNEPNDTMYQAIPMTFGHNYRGMFHIQEDQDWFKFTLEDTSLIELYLDGIPNGAQVTAELMNQNGRSIKDVISPTGEEKGIRLEQILSKGTYYVRLTTDTPFDDRLYSLRIYANVLVGGFSDISSHWAKDQIILLREKGIVKGYEDTLFRPDDLVSRAEAAALIARTFMLEKKSNFEVFDVTPSHWAYESVSQVIHALIMTPDEQGLFQPNELVSRADMVNIFANALRARGQRGESPFSDVSDDDPILPLLLRLHSIGWVNGYLDGTFRPDQSMTRAEFATMLTKQLK